jgi:non-homologous end joining protein Ku
MMATNNFRRGKWNPRTSSDKYKRRQLRKFIEKKAQRKKAEYRETVVKPAKRLVDKLREIAHSRDTPENKFIRAIVACVQKKHPQFSYIEAMDYFFKKVEAMKKAQS